MCYNNFFANFSPTKHTPSLSLTTMRRPSQSFCAGRGKLQNPNGPIGKAASRPGCNEQLGVRDTTLLQKAPWKRVAPLCTVCFSQRKNDDEMRDAIQITAAVDAIRHVTRRQIPHRPPCAGCDTAVRACSVNPATRTVLDI